MGNCQVTEKGDCVITINCSSCDQLQNIKAPPDMQCLMTIEEARSIKQPYFQTEPQPPIDQKNQQNFIILPKASLQSLSESQLDTLHLRINKDETQQNQQNSFFDSMDLPEKSIVDSSTKNGTNQILEFDESKVNVFYEQSSEEQEGKNHYLSEQVRPICKVLPEVENHQYSYLKGVSQHTQKFTNYLHPNHRFIQANQTLFDSPTRDKRRVLDEFEHHQKLVSRSPKRQENPRYSEVDSIYVNSICYKENLNAIFDVRKKKRLDKTLSKQQKVSSIRWNR